MTNYEKIKNMSIDEMSEMFTELLHTEDLKILNLIRNSGYNASLIEVDKNIQKKIHRRYLESEAEE